jgi:hypothetical protein
MNYVVENGCLCERDVVKLKEKYFKTKYRHVGVLLKYAVF